MNQDSSLIPGPESVVAFLMVTAIYLALIALVGLSSKSNSLRLIGLGLLTAIASVGYAGFIPTALATASSMMKIAFLLVFAGTLFPFMTSLDSNKFSPETRPLEGELRD